MSISLATRRWVFGAAVGSTACVSASYAQVTPECETDFDHMGYTLHPDSVGVAGTVTAKFTLEMPYDSSRIRYDWAELRKSGKRLRLVGWCGTRFIRSHTIEALNDSTRTESFLVNAGDTLSFSRLFSWAVLVPDSSFSQSSSSCYALDTLDFVVELLDASTHERRARIDSLGVLRQQPIGPPTIYGENPLAAQIRYIVPPSLDGDTVFLRLRTDARGDGEFTPARRDGLDIGLSSFLSDSLWIAYNQYMGSALAKRSMNDLRTIPAFGASARLTLIDGLAGDRQISVEATVAADQPATLTVCDERGSALFVPAMWPDGVPHRRAIVNMEIDRRGAFYIVLTLGGKIAAVAPVNVP